MNNHFYRWFSRPMRQGAALKSLLKTSLMAITMLVSLSTFAQDKTVSGKVTDAADGSGMPGVSIAVAGANKGTQTDVNGNYKLSVGDNATLVFSFVGYTKQEIAVGSRSVIDVKLGADNKSLEEVVVVGYGTQKRKEISGTVSSLSSRDFNAGVVNNPLVGAAGKVAGLVITQSSGDPSARPTVRLRGTGSLSGNSEPLYVVDGVIGAPIENIAPEDIQTMDVLRDASSAAIYGSRGANGVIIITTKRGKAGATQVDYNGYVGTEMISQRPQLMNGAEFRAAAQKFNQPFTDGGADTDWLKVITRTAASQNHNLGVSGGSENFSYRASVGYLKQTGTVIGSSKDRLNARLNLDSKAMDGKLKIGFSVSTSQSDAVLQDDIALGLIYNMRPTDPVYNPDGTYFQLPGTFSNFNPLARLESNTRNEKLRDILGNVSLAYSITPDLTARISGTLRTQGNDFSRITRSTPGNLLQVNGGNSAGRSYGDVNDQQLDFTMNYNKVFGKSTLGLLGGYTYQGVVNSGFGVANSNFLTDDFGADNLGSGIGVLGQQNYGIGSGKSEYKLISFLGRVQYGYDDKYFATINLRQDGSTKFGKNNQWGFFPSASIGWNLSKEDFLKGVPNLDNLKLRVSWGRTGSSEGISPYASRSFWGVTGGYYDPATNATRPSYGITSNANPNLKWEVNENYGAGIDFSLWKGRLTGNIDWYTRDTKDLLYTVAAPQEKGFPFPRILANVGSMTNKGVEISLSYQWLDTKDFSFSSVVASSFNSNKITSLSNATEGLAAPERTFLETGLGSFIRGTSAVNFSVLTPGQPLGVFYGAVVSGIDDKGKYIFKDLDGDGKVAETPEDGDKTYIGDPNPFFVGSITNQFKYKGFDLSFMVTGNFGAKVMNTNQLLLGRKDGRIAESSALKSAIDSKVDDNRTISMDYYVESADFVRIANAQIGYTIPATSKILKRARIYVAGNNLALFTSYKGVDPEVSQELRVDGNRRAPGIDVRETYFKTRAFTFGVNLSF